MGIGTRVLTLMPRWSPFGDHEILLSFFTACISRQLYNRLFVFFTEIQVYCFRSKVDGTSSKQVTPVVEKREKQARKEQSAGSGNRGRRHEKRKGDVVQSHSIFEQGPTEKSIKPS